MKVSSFGFEKAVGLINSLKEMLTIASKQTALDVGDKAQKLLIAHIDNQDLNWIPLSEKYLQKKKKEGLQTNIWEATSDLKKAIAISQFDKSVAIGVLKGRKNREGEDLALIASVLEYGSAKRNIPARPLFRYTAEELKSYIKEKKPFYKILFEKLKRFF